MQNKNRMSCSFCISIGLKGPFNHNLKVGDNIICPLLLNTTCLLCGKKGHTSKYCKRSTVTTNKDNFKSRWAGLEIEDDTSSDSETEEISTHFINPKTNGIISNKENNSINTPPVLSSYEVNKRWADLVEEPDNGELPPIPKDWSKH